MLAWRSAIRSISTERATDLRRFAPVFLMACAGPLHSGERSRASSAFRASSFPAQPGTLCAPGRNPSFPI